ncbi:MAG: molybdopterin molybdotransferase MoeA [Treponema sp.]|jgi:molybdopterin molybdotransferase|nr:molybdopterin molybdotransferase MoeA [Treponema sp.]
MEPTNFFPNRAIPVDSAIAILLERIPEPKGSMLLPLLEALHRIAGENRDARIALPPFDNSPLDGFALRHADSAGAGRDKPIFLRVVETIYAGDLPQKSLAPGECARVMTGAVLPEGATCVIPLEDTDNQPDTVGIFHALAAHQNYRFHGEVMRQGQPILRKGERITGAHVGLLAAQGFTEIPVFARPRVGILSTGSELMSGPEPLIPGKIYDSNRYLLAARVLALGAEPVWTSTIADDPALIAHAVEELLETCDCIISTGGVSVGAHDYMPQVGSYLAAEPLFRRVQMKPGGWVTALYKDTKIILCLSGNPFAAAMSFDLLAGPMLRRLAGAAPVLLQHIPGVLQEPFPKANPQGRFLYARREGKEVFLPQAGHVSGSLASLIGCNCIVQIPPGKGPLNPGDKVDLIPLSDGPVSPSCHPL